jgi:hypothetical protein
MSVRAFAEHLGVAVRTVSKWEQLLTATVPRPDTQAVLDTALARAEAPVHLRFEADLSGTVQRTSVLDVRRTAGPRPWEYESWTDDLDRVVVALSRQDFRVADSLLSRWLDFRMQKLDSHGLYLLGRSMVLLGDLRRDQGLLTGALSAHHAYGTARAIFSHLDIPRRLAQVELLIVLVDEMSWNIDSAVHRYELFAADERLSRRDRTRARLWMGRALSKQGDYDGAIPAMIYAAREFEDLGEPDSWSVAQQKIALALRGRGDLDGALRRIQIARSGGSDGSPLQRVRLSTAHAHILLSDLATRDEGRFVLDGTARVADDYGLGHQLRSIENIRRSGGASPATAPQV